MATWPKFPTWKALTLSVHRGTELEEDVQNLRAGVATGFSGSVKSMYGKQNQNSRVCHMRFVESVRGPWLTGGGQDSRNV